MLALQLSFYVQLPDASFFDGELNDPALFWRRAAEDPHLASVAQLARAALTFPASSAATECLFSSTGFLQSDRRQNLSFESLESLVYIRQNWNVGGGTCHDLVKSTLDRLNDAEENEN
jgi:hAT family C-terminal dimerisation region